MTALGTASAATPASGGTAFDARAKLVAAGALVTAALLVHTLAGAVLLLVLVLGALAIARVRARNVLTALQPLIVLALAVLVFQGLLGSDEPVAVVPGLQVHEPFAHAALRLAQLFTVVLLAFAVTATTGPMQLAAGMRWLLAPLRVVRVPVDEMALMVAIGLGFVPTMTSELARLRRAQQARGVDLRRARLQLALRLRIALVVPLVVLAFRRAHHLSEAMRVRGFVPGARRTSYRPLRAGAGDLLLVVASLLLAVALAVYG